ncbi:MAG TPA: hypothetical protein VL307_09450 [Chitinophagaceae bacterium]|nr:hypothetical protein [Chitinophagaceae bacterium]
MKKTILVFLGSLSLLASCQKSISDFDPSTPQGSNGTMPAGSGVFEASINGQSYSFTVVAATLLRSTQYNQKRLDIGGISKDNSKRLIITLGEETSTGNSMSVKQYVLNPFPQDDPATPNIDESNTTQGFSTYSTSLGNNSWLTNVYDEDGIFTVTSCDANTKLISGSFSSKLVDLIDNSVIKITGGKITNVKYNVVN